VALEAADVALMQDDISKLPYLMDLSKKTLEVVRQNILLSLVIKGAFAVLVFPGYVTSSCFSWICYIMDGCFIWGFGVNFCCDSKCDENL